MNTFIQLFSDRYLTESHSYPTVSNSISFYLTLSHNPPTSLSIERVRTHQESANPSASQLTPFNSLSTSASQPALRTSWLLACKPASSHTGSTSDATGDLRTSQQMSGDLRELDLGPLRSTPSWKSISSNREIPHNISIDNGYVVPNFRWRLVLAEKYLINYMFHD